MCLRCCKHLRLEAVKFLQCLCRQFWDHPPCVLARCVQHVVQSARASRNSCSIIWRGAEVSQGNGLPSRAEPRFRNTNTYLCLFFRIGELLLRACWYLSFSSEDLNLQFAFPSFPNYGWGEFIPISAQKQHNVEVGPELAQVGAKAMDGHLKVDSIFPELTQSQLQADPKTQVGSASCIRSNTGWP